MNGYGDPQAALIAEIQEFLTERGIAEATFGNLAVRDSRIMDRLRAGNVSFRVGQRMRDYIARERQRGIAGPAS